MDVELSVLTAVAKTLVAPLELSELLDGVMRTIVQVLEKADIGAIMLWDQPAGLFKPVAAIGYDLGILREIGLRAGESITGKAYDEGEIPDKVELSEALTILQQTAADIISEYKD